MLKILALQMILKNKKSNKKSLDEQINLIPMINLVFLLLIFFLLTGIIQKKETEIVTRPYSDFSNERSNLENEMVITINQNGEIFFKEELVDLERIQEIVSPRQNKITLDIDKKLKIFQFNKIIKRLKNKNIRKIYIKTAQKK